jgi:hypothetical protein
MKHNYLFIIFSVLFFASCDIINPTEKIPAYISIDTFLLTTDVGLQGSNASKITDAWIYVNDNPIGIFELPCKVPALNEGSCKVTVAPGIRTNGISATRSIYPFYKFYDVQVDLKPEIETKIIPTTTYFDSISFPYKTNFDDIAGISLEATSKSDTTIFITTNPDEVFEGNGSLKAIITKDTGYLEFRQVDPVILPKQGAIIFAELNFKCNKPITVVLYSNYPSSAPNIDNIISLAPTEGKWNKIYIDLTRFVSTNVNAINYRLYFNASKADNKGPLFLYMDNLKIVAQQP